MKCTDWCTNNDILDGKYPKADDTPILWINWQQVVAADGATLHVTVLTTQQQSELVIAYIPEDGATLHVTGQTIQLQYELVL